MLGSVNDVATKAIMSDKQMRKLGPMAIARYEEMREHEARINTLALYHTNGDTAKLMAGDLDPDLSPVEREKVAQEVFSIQDKLGSHVAWFDNQMSKEGRQWGDSDAVARRLLNLPKDADAPLTPEQTKSLAETKQAVTTAQKLDDGTLTKLTDRDRFRRNLDDDAKKLDVTTDELLAYKEKGVLPKGRSAASMTPLNDKEVSRIDAATTKYGQYSRERDPIITEMDTLTKGLQKKDLDPKVREQMQTKLKALEEQKANKNERMTSAMSEIDDISKDRGVSSFELAMERKRYTTEAEDKVAQGHVKTYRENQTELEARAAELGLPGGIDDLNAGHSAIKLVDAQADKFQAEEEKGTSPLVQQVFGKFGFDQAKHGEQISKLAQSLGDDTGRMFLRKVIGTSEQLQSIAKRGSQIRDKQAADGGKSVAERERLTQQAGKLRSSADDPMRGVAEMTREYDEIQGDKDLKSRDTKLKKFRTDYGIDSEMEYDQLTQAMKFQAYTGLGKAGDTGSGSADKRSEMLSRSLDVMRQGGDMREVTQAADGQRQEIHFTGDLHVTSENRGDMNGRGHHAVTPKGN